VFHGVIGEPRIKDITSVLIISVVVILAVTGLAISPWNPRSTADMISICEIQGHGFQSPYAGETIRTWGNVHGDLDTTSRRGFFMQNEGCDGDRGTSDGIFVYLGESVQVVNPGDRVEVSGKVQEYYGLTEIVASPGDVKLLSSGNPLPNPVELSPPFDDQESSRYFEQREGMYVRVGDAGTVGPTDAQGRSWLVRSDLKIERVFHDDPRGTGEVICIDDGGTYQVDPQVKVGDRVSGLLGAQDYRGGEFCMQLFSNPVVDPVYEGARLPDLDLNQVGESSPSSLGFTIASYNMANLFDTVDDPETEDSVLTAAEYQRRLNKRTLTIHETLAEPHLIAVQEVENAEVMQALVLRPELAAEYDFILVDGPDRRGMDIALLYRIDRIQVTSYEVQQGCTSLVDGLGPDGNDNVYEPANDLTCDTDNNGSLDGNRLFSRPPLVVQLNVCDGECQVQDGHLAGDAENGITFHIINNHFKSKLQDSEVTEYTRPRRMEQASFVRSLVEEILAAEPYANLVVLGDLNDHADSEVLSLLDDLLSNQITRVPWTERYTYIYKGRSQVLDHALVCMHLGFAPVEFNLKHINADYPVVYESVDNSVIRSSDHDLLLMRFDEIEKVNNLPLVLR
jgi:predicted extracellular nuclease